MNTILLTAGKIDYTLLPFGMHQSNATIPVNGKPVISWILDDLIRKGFTQVTVVLRDENTRLKRLLINHYSKRLQLDIIPVLNPKSILESLHFGLESLSPNQEGVQVILGDTLIRDSYSNLMDCVYCAEVKNSENWCVAETDKDSRLVTLHDKMNLPGVTHRALCGYYSFTDTALLKQSVTNCIGKNWMELSAVLLFYHSLKPLALKQATEWFDFGHLESFIHSKKSLLRPRHFNQLYIDPLLNTITKVSSKNDKLLDELNWYLDLPEPLKVLTPRIYTKEQKNEQITITQEFYGYPSLSELFVYGDLGLSVWESILNYLFEIHGLFKKYEKKCMPDLLHEIYIHKTNERIHQMLAQGNNWEELWNKPTIVFNGHTYLNIQDCLAKLTLDIEQLKNRSSFHIIHGDYCLSNILYDLNNQIVRLIDPRGSFGEKGIYGDARYDIAKLRHSVVGLYDYIVGDLFSIQQTTTGFNYKLLEDEKNTYLANYIDKCIEKYGYDLREIKLIEGLLFLSMIPYHADYTERQYMMYVRSTEIFNELIENN